MTAPDDTDYGQARPISTALTIVDVPLLLCEGHAWCLGYWDGRGSATRLGFTFRQPPGRRCQSPRCNEAQISLEHNILPT